LFRFCTTRIGTERNKNNKQTGKGGRGGITHPKKKKTEKTNKPDPQKKKQGSPTRQGGEITAKT